MATRLPQWRPVDRRLCHAYRASLVVDQRGEGVERGRQSGEFCHAASLSVAKDQGEQRLRCGRCRPEAYGCMYGTPGTASADVLLSTMDMSRKQEKKESGLAPPRLLFCCFSCCLPPWSPGGSGGLVPPVVFLFVRCEKKFSRGVRPVHSCISAPSL